MANMVWLENTYLVHLEQTVQILIVCFQFFLLTVFIPLRHEKVTQGGRNRVSGNRVSG